MNNRVRNSYKEFLLELNSRKSNNILIKELYIAIEHHMNIPGKLIRPILMATVNEDLNSNYEKIERYALALELIHNYSLIHDDLPAMDNDDYRRGIPTIHKKYNEAIAILAGDFLIGEAILTLLKDSEINKDALQFFLNQINDYGMLGGQVIDINPDLIKNIDELLSMYDKKTSALFKCSFVIPGIINNLDYAEIRDLERIGKLFGLYFQIRDDINDFEKDRINAKTTIFSFLNDNDISNLLTEYKDELFDLLNKLHLVNTIELLESMI